VFPLVESSVSGQDGGQIEFEPPGGSPPVPERVGDDQLVGNKATVRAEELVRGRRVGEQAVLERQARVGQRHGRIGAHGQRDGIGVNTRLILEPDHQLALQLDGNGAVSGQQSRDGWRVGIALHHAVETRRPIRLRAEADEVVRGNEQPVRQRLPGLAERGGREDAVLLGWGRVPRQQNPVGWVAGIP
jgi:hypothetical protein